MRDLIAMAEQRVIDALKYLVWYVGESSESLRQQGRSTATQLAYGGGALEMLERVGLITFAELEHWFARVHEAAGGDDEHPLSDVRND
jgi:hypothetical protein